MLLIGCILERGGKEEECFLLQGIVGANNRFCCSTIISELAERNFIDWVLCSCHYVIIVKFHVFSFRFFSLYTDFHISCKCKFMLLGNFLSSIVSLAPPYQ